MSLDFPDPADLLNFTFTIKPDEGFYRNGTFQFDFHVKDSYPMEPPKVRCRQKVRAPAWPSPAYLTETFFDRFTIRISILRAPCA